MDIEYRYTRPDALWQNALSRVYLFHGEDDLQKRAAIEALTRRCVDPDFVDFDLEKLDARTAGVQEILASAGQSPFASERRLVIVSGAESWRERGKAADAEKLALALPGAAPSATIVLVVAAMGDEARRKTVTTAKLDAAVRENGSMVRFPALQGEPLIDWLTYLAKSAGKTLDRAAAAELAATGDAQPIALKNEIDKLIDYVGDSARIGIDAVRSVTSATPDDVAFRVVDAVMRRDADMALTLLAELSRFEPRPHALAGRLLALLSRQLRMIWQVRGLMERGFAARDLRSLPEEAMAELPNDGRVTQLAFRANELFTTARQFSTPELENALEQVLLCDLANKGGVTEEESIYGSDPSRNLQLLLLQICGKLGAREAAPQMAR